MVGRHAVRCRFFVFCFLFRSWCGFVVKTAVLFYLLISRIAFWFFSSQSLVVYYVVYRNFFAFIAGLFFCWSILTYFDVPLSSSLSAASFDALKYINCIHGRPFVLCTYVLSSLFYLFDPASPPPQFTRQAPCTYSHSTVMSLVKLTSLSTQTLSLLLERQRLQSISQFQSPTAQQRTSNLHLPQIIRNLNQLRTGILELEAKNGASSAEAAGLLRNQYGRMIGMLGSDAESLGIER